MYKPAESAIQAGMVIIQVYAMFFIELCLTEELPLAKPTPMTAPTSVCVGEIGIPNDMNRKTTEAVDI